MVQILGYVVVFLCLILGAWWVTSNRQNKAWAFAMCLVGIFVGIFLIVNERATELTIKNVGTIKTAAVNAKADAQAIKKLREQVEKQAEITGELKNAIEQGAVQTSDLLGQVRVMQNQLWNTQQKLSLIDEQFQKTSPIQAAPRLVLASHKSRKTSEGIEATLIFKAIGNLTLGKVEFVLNLKDKRKVKILNIGTTVPIALTVMTSISEDGRTAKISYINPGNADPGIRVTLTAPTKLTITGSPDLEPVEVSVNPDS